MDKHEVRRKRRKGSDERGGALQNDRVKRKKGKRGKERLRRIRENSSDLKEQEGDNVA